MNPGSRPANFTNVRDYLTKAYLVSDEDIMIALAKPANRELIDTGTRMASLAYYPGDEIAEREHWYEDTTYDADADT